MEEVELEQHRRLLGRDAGQPRPGDNGRPPPQDAGQPPLPLRPEVDLAPVIVTSVLDCAAPCYIHILPVFASIVIIYFNGSGYFIGAHLGGPVAMSDDAKLDAFQGAAKVHEILIVASMAAAVFDATRYFLLRGSGLPLGLVGAGFNFSQGTFLLSVIITLPPPAVCSVEI